MASGDSGDSPSNAAIAAMEGGGGQWPGGDSMRLSCPTWKWGGGVGRRWPGDIFFDKVRTVGKPPSGASFLQKHVLNIGCNTPRWDLC